MSTYKPLDDRQVINRAALTHIGSPANDSLDDIFNRIDSIIAGLSSGGGYIAKKTALTNGSTSLVVTIPSQPDTSYVVLAMMGNTTDAFPQHQQVEVTSKSTSGFTLSWNHPLDTANYFISYIIPFKALPEAEVAISLATNSVSVLFPIGYNGSGVIAELQNIVDAHPQFQAVVVGAPNGANVPTVQKFLSGSGTYTKPANVAYIKVKMSAGGGGGGGGGGTTGGSGSAGNGGNSTFGSSLLVANGGQGGKPANSGASGGSASLGVGPIGVAISGGSGGGSSQGPVGGGAGGVNPFGGTGGGGVSSGIILSGLGMSGVANTGAGGGGGGSDSGQNNGSGGGAGGYIEAIITSPSATYTYSVGAGGTAGVGPTTNGGAGGSGIIIVEEYDFNGLNVTSNNLEWNVATDTGNYQAVYVAAATGQAVISNSATSVVIPMPVNFNTANYAIIASIQNTVDINPQFQPMIITAQSGTSATIGWNVARDTGNYLINYYAISLTP